MVVTVLLALVCLASATMLVRQVIAAGDKPSIGGAPLYAQRLEFGLTESGKYTIWTKRNTKWSLLKRGVHNFTYELTDKATGKILPLTKQKDGSDISNNRRARQPWIENVWKTHYSFEAPAGTYVLTFKKLDVVSDAVGGFGIFNLFREINAEKYTVQITPYYSKVNGLKNGLLMALYFLLMFVSLILLLTPAK